MERVELPFQREDSLGDVVDEPVDALQQILTGHGAAPHDVPVVALDAVQLLRGRGQRSIETSISLSSVRQTTAHLSDLLAGQRAGQILATELILCKFARFVLINFPLIYRITSNGIIALYR
jgi:hypothetical protein